MSHTGFKPPSRQVAKNSLRLGDLAVQNLDGQFIRQYRRLKPGPVPPFQIQFYPYSNLTHTIRIRQGRIIVKLSDILVSAGGEVLESLLSILLHKLFQRSISPASRRAYLEYVRLPEVRGRIRETRRKRGRKILTSPRGKTFDLSTLFRQLNQQFFAGGIAVRHLSWSRRKNRRILGHYDATHQAIIIDRRLDSPVVPEYVVRYVLFHEMLHAELGEEQGACGRRIVHHRRFREQERRFPDYSRARRFIRRFL